MSGGVWESNPLGALFTPPTGFEDQGRHQPCKHPRNGPTHCKARGAAGKTGFRRVLPGSAAGEQPTHLRPADRRIDAEHQPTNYTNVSTSRAGR